MRALPWAVVLVDHPLVILQMATFKNCAGWAESLKPRALRPRRCLVSTGY
jgi:hypothetical protein